MVILIFFINSLLAERLSKPINGAATKSINPECQEEHAAVACEDNCFLSNIPACPVAVVTIGTVLQIVTQSIRR